MTAQTAAVARSYGGAVARRGGADPGPDPSRRDGPPAEDAGTAGDADLAVDFARGRDGSLARVYREHSSLVFSIAARAVGAVEAEDVTQAVFVAAWRGRATYDPARGTLAGWLVDITRHRVADTMAARRRRGEVLVEEVGSVLDGQDAVGGHDQAVSDRLTVMGAVEDLDEPRRTVVALAFFEEMTHREISVVTGLPLGTVKSHLRRSLLHLRALLEGPVATGPASVDLTATPRTPTDRDLARRAGWRTEEGQA